MGHEPYTEKPILVATGLDHDWASPLGDTVIDRLSRYQNGLTHDHADLWATPLAYSQHPEGVKTVVFQRC